MIVAPRFTVNSAANTKAPGVPKNLVSVLLNLKSPMTTNPKMAIQAG